MVRPERKDYDKSPIEQVLGYVEEIRAGAVETSAGRTIQVNGSTPFYCYIACDMTEELRRFAQLAGLTKTPDQMGYFGFNPNYNAYIEILSFDKLVQDARKRNHVLFERLQLTPR